MCNRGGLGRLPPPPAPSISESNSYRIVGKFVLLAVKSSNIGGKISSTFFFLDSYQEMHWKAKTFTCRKGFWNFHRRENKFPAYSTMDLGLSWKVLDKLHKNSFSQQWNSSQNLSAGKTFPSVLLLGDRNCKRICFPANKEFLILNNTN